VGRRPYTANLALDKANVSLSAKGFVEVNSCFQTNVPHIFAIGDVIEGIQLAHRASEEGRIVADFLIGSKKKLNYISIPNVIYTNPEVATVGITEEEAKSFGIEVLVASEPFRINARAHCQGETEGFIKVIANKATRELVGVHMIGPHVSEMIAEACLAIDQRIKFDSLQRLSHAHPTLSETFKDALLKLRK